MLLRISLILAIIAALGAGTVSYFEMTDKIPALQKQRDQEHDAKHVALTQLDQTNRALVFTKGKLAETEQQLADTKSERDKALVRADAQTKRADELNAELTKAKGERDDAQNQLAAYKATDLTPEQIIALSKQVKDANLQIAAITEEKAVLLRKLTSTQAKLDKLIGPDIDIKLPADLKGKVVKVDPKWDFVVLNIGEKQGVIQEGELLVSRDGKLVAKVIVHTVDKDTCIANIVPGWKLGEPLEGDEVSPAHPAS
jgi:hypothetical protein